MTDIRALSLSRPWTELILNGHKPIENRTWKTPYRGPLVIDGAQSWRGDEAADLAEKILNGSAVAFAELRHLKALYPLGYIGVVDLTYICTRRLDGLKCTCGPWALPYSAHWWLENPRRFPEPIEGPGRLGLYTPPDDVITATREVLATQPQEANH